jgi:integrase
MRSRRIPSQQPLPVGRRTKVVEQRHFAAVLDCSEVGESCAAERIDACSGVKRAHNLLVFCMQRIGEIVGADWNEFDLQRGFGRSRANA